MDCSPTASTGASPTSPAGGSPTSRSRKPGAVIESFVNHAPGVFSGTFSGRCHGIPCEQSREPTPGMGHTPRDPHACARPYSKPRVLMGGCERPCHPGFRLHM